MGMGIDRLLMAITGLGIRKTILFPGFDRTKFSILLTQRWP
jgi:lysyl-tRNA synthetase class II